MRRVFADTFYFLAVLNRGDPAREQALRYYGDPTVLIVTTEWVLVEVGDAMAVPPARQKFKELTELLKAEEQISVLPATHELFERGAALYFQRADKKWSLTDCISFVVMTEEGITDALTGDHHFEQAGFRALLK